MGWGQVPGYTFQRHLTEFEGESLRVTQTGKVKEGVGGGSRKERDRLPYCVMTECLHITLSVLYDKI